MTRGFTTGLALLGLVLGTPAGSAGLPRFGDATAESGITYRNVCGAAPEAKGWLSESMGAGAAWLDYDGDGMLDLYLVNGSTYDRAADRGEPNRLFRGDGKGRFVDVTEAAGVGHRGWGFGVAVGDFDNDGHPDLFVTNLGPNVLYRNRGDGTFRDVTAQAGVAGGDRFSSSAAFFDMEGDGDLDLYVANYMACDPAQVPRRGTPECVYQGLRVSCGPRGQTPQQDVLYRNDGGGKFTDVSRESGIFLATPRFGLGVVTGDYDNDGDQDIYVANDSVANSLWRNAGDGTFVDVGLSSLTALSGEGQTQAGMGTDFGDYDGDGWLDIAVTNFAHDLNTIYRNTEGKYFTDVSTSVGMSVTRMALSWGVGFEDFDNDGDLDLFVANGHVYPEVDSRELGTRYRQANHLFLNDGARFREISAEAGPGLKPLRSFRGAAFGDYDNDGDVDVALTALDEEFLLLRNDTPARGHWLRLRLVGTRSNRDAVGARVTLTAGARTQVRERKGGGSYLSAGDTRLHFGLDTAERVDRLEIRWPSGGVTVLRDLPVDRELSVRETP